MIYMKILHHLQLVIVQGNYSGRRLSHLKQLFVHPGYVWRHKMKWFVRRNITFPLDPLTENTYNVSCNEK